MAHNRKEFEILDLDPPINATSHYGACYFRYNLALTTPHEMDFRDPYLSQVSLSPNVVTTTPPERLDGLS